MPPPLKRTTTISGSISIPSTYGRTTTSPSPGVVAGIVLGSLAGFLFLLYLIYLALTSGRRFGSETTPTEIVDVFPGAPSSFGRRSRRPGRSVRSGHAGREHVIVEEESVTSASAFRSDLDDGGEVIVEEEPSTVDEGRSLSPAGRRMRGVRGVDPMAYGGGSSITSRS